MKKIITLATVCASTCFAAQADVRINGFANLIGGITTSSDETLYGYDDAMNFAQESLFAVQISGDINDKMTATGQLIARAENDYETKFEWAYLTYQASDNLNLSIGRFRLPLFNYSASSEVAYSYHWVNTPQTVYNVPFNNLEGIKLDYSNYAGDWEYSITGSYGSFKDDSTGIITEGDNTLIFSAEASYESFKIRGVWGTAKIHVDLSHADSPSSVGLHDGLTAMANSGFATLADSLFIDDDTGTFVGLSVNYDTFDWFVGGEITQITLDDSFAGDDLAYYLTAGFRTGKWTPSITYETLETDTEIKFQDQINQIATSALPDSAKQQFTGLAVGAQLAQETDNHIITAAVRYDHDTNVAFKVDISKYDDKVDNANNATLVRFAVNYVF